MNYNIEKSICLTRIDLLIHTYYSNIITELPIYSFFRSCSWNCWKSRYFSCYIFLTGLIGLYKAHQNEGQEVFTKQQLFV